MSRYTDHQSRSWLDDNLRPATLHYLSRPYPRRLTALGLTVHGDFARGHELLALSPALGDAGELEQVAQADVFAS